MQRPLHHVRFVPTSDMAEVDCIKEKAARRRLLNSNPVISDQAAIKAGFDFRR